ncbi:hypothetical protein M6D93_06940 [Jatrophihabitans telluris]|uniref:Uncharacterized protein n=1 Tax=Jatrophihabitans telluris TaxID=2038343 RepID=A0ABY4R3Q9_9ACTN|nr:hypothetical protein [Jatrophihabitans telluris]UQX89730.1 hypothetical protein M6D93_06940 [Jatrophihabitans telluris]
MAESIASTVHCQRCGRISDPGRDGDPPLTWAMDREGERVRWTCPACVSLSVRSMEAKLDPEWW